MRDRPDARELLLRARASLLERLLDAVPESERFETLMIANAMAIAARAAEPDETPLAREHEALCGILGEAPEANDLAMAWRLSSEIRAGRFDGAAAVHDLLWANTIRRLRVTNPKILKLEGLD